MPLLCSTSCESADNCGPTSEWPTCNSGSTGGKGSDDPAQSDGDDENSGEPPKDPGVKKDAGKNSGNGGLDGGVSVRDAATAPPVTEIPDSAGSNTDDAGADAGDAGDARVPSIDGGSPADCTIESDGRDAGACYGVYCSVPKDNFSKLSGVGGACSGDDLALACDGEISRVVSQCAQNDVFALGFGRTVALCAGRAPSLAKASEGCVSCYVDEVLCALEMCLAPCLNGDSKACTECRLDNCSLDFRTCSGLPAANEHVIVDNI